MHPIFKLEIPKRLTLCCLQGERFLGGIDIHSALYEDESGKWTRKDFCPACWEQMESQLPSGRIAWKSKNDKKEKPPLSGKIQSAFQLFRQFIDSPENMENEIFVLGLFLAHAKQLIFRKELQQNGEWVHLYEVPKTGECFFVKTCVLTAIEIETIRQSLASKLTEQAALK